MISMSIFQPLVSIVCNTYNHEPYIEECLRSFLNQQCNLSFEIIIHDDASTDATQEIIHRYEKEFPHIIFPIYQRQNKHSLGIKPTTYYQLPRARGKYIATCEGDDYWTDPRKLQIQVDFLEAHPDYVCCYHNAIIIDEMGEIVSDSKLSENDKRDYSQEELKGVSCFMLTLTLLFRNIIHPLPPEYNYVKNGDDFLASLLGGFGKGKYLGLIQPAVYRKHSGGIWSSLSDISKLRARIVTSFYMAGYYQRTGEEHYAQHFKHRLIAHAHNLQNADPTVPRDLQQLIESIVMDHHRQLEVNNVKG